MAKSPKKITPRLTSDVREAIREMSKAPFGRPGKVTNFPQLTTAEAEELKARETKKPPLFVKREGQKLTAKQIDNIAKRISRERGIAYNQAKELLWEELSKAPISKDVKQPGTMLAKAIPTREQFEATGYRAVQYQGKTIYLSPAQVKQVAKDLGIKVEFKDGSSNLFGESPTGKSQYEKITGLSPEARAVQDRKAAAEAERLRSEAIKDWETQAKAAETNPRVRKPAEAIGKASPASAKSEAYAERLYQRTFKELTPKERKAIQMIIEQEARNAAKAQTPKVGKGVTRGSYKPPTVNLPKFNGGGVLGFAGVVLEGMFSYKQMLAEQERRKREIT